MVNPSVLFTSEYRVHVPMQCPGHDSPACSPFRLITIAKIKQEELDATKTTNEQS